ncbi:ABC transporter permease [Ensifer sp. 4252]|uniref:ABC transporter permease n=1 Tax=Ensifer sp. 4252 TaxID=3373915 RepID=UPI003D1CF8B9
MQTLISNDAKGPSSGFRQMMNVMHAVILRDIRSRFFNHGLGFLIVPLLPLAHVGLLLTIYHVTNREVVFGDDLQLFFATGLAPALGFNYLSRFMSVSLQANKGMTAFPVVRVLDIMLARAFLEFMGMNLAIFVLLIALTISGSDIFPRDPAAALQAYAVTMTMGVGVGIIISVFAAIWPLAALFWALFIVVLYLASDGPIYLHAFPGSVLQAASWNPVFHAVQWVRSAYYPGYPTEYLDKTYLISWAFASVAVGLLLERLLKRQILRG